MSRTYSPKTAPIYQFKIALDYITPAIWRRFLVSSNITLDRLHDTIQIVMGWTNSHLHMFEIDGRRLSDHQYEDFEELDTEDERNFRLRKIIGHAGLRFQYMYDFGDGWRHTLLLEKILPPDPAHHLPVCLEGKRACPPEDVGGIGGYANFLEALRNPKHEEHEEYLTWVGGKYDPNAFDLELVNRQLRKMKIAPVAWQKEETPSWPVEKKSQAPQPPTLNEEQRQAVKALPLRRDVLTLLNYLRDNRVTGTQSTGNLPLKDIRAICGQLVDPPQLETRIGEFVSRIRSEDDVWPLYFVHVLASVGGLIAGGPGRRWQLTPLGEKFLDSPAEIQVWLLFLTWWTQVNWGIAWSSAPDEFPPAHIRKIIFKCLLGLPEGHTSPYDRFADQVLEASRLTWPHGDGSQERSILHSLIESTVAKPLDQFGILNLEYGPHPTWGARFHELRALTLTALGKSLLGSMKE
jgi:hypothetical protein